jgi:tripartite-type tricarboxylate transporter receptor subunit TctC
MRHRSRPKTHPIKTGITAAICAGLVPVAANAAGPADFYDGKTITVTVAGSAGASLALYCRILVAHWSAHIPGKPNVICDFRPGGGGTTAAAWIYNKGKKDGTDVGQILAPSIIAPELRGGNYNPKEFVWLGSVTPRPSVVSVWHTSPAKTVDEAKKTEITMGSSGFGSSTYMIPMFMNATLGTKFKVIRGYKGGAPINKAMEQGEVLGRMQYWSGWTSVKQAWLKEKKIFHLVQYGPEIPELKDVPHLRDLMKTPEQKQMMKFLEIPEHVGIGMYLPPGVPKDRVAALRTSFVATMKDKKFLEDAKSKRAPVEPISGEGIQKLVDEALNTPEPVLATLRGYLKFKKK